MPRRSLPRSAKYRPACTKPCSECPFRRNAAAGWLGAANPESFIIEISMERPLPCHKTIDYEQSNWLGQWERQRIGFICAGALIMTANMAKLPRDPAFPRMQSDRALVFATHREFIDYHRAAPTRSWELGDDAERERR